MPNSKATNFTLRLPEPTTQDQLDYYAKKTNIGYWLGAYTNSIDCNAGNVKNKEYFYISDSDNVTLSEPGK